MCTTSLCKIFFSARYHRHRMPLPPFPHWSLAVGMCYSKSGRLLAILPCLEASLGESQGPKPQDKAQNAHRQQISGKLSDPKAWTRRWLVFENAPTHSAGPEPASDRGGRVCASDANAPGEMWGWEITCHKRTMHCMQSSNDGLNPGNSSLICLRRKSWLGMFSSETLLLS